MHHPIPSPARPPAIQLYSVRSLLVDHFEDTLRALANIGFSAVEGYGEWGGMQPARLADFMAGIGIRVMGLHAPLADLLNAHSRPYAMARALRSEFVTVSLPDAVASDPCAAAAPLIRANAVAADQGLILTYHNHASEFARQSDGRSALEVLFDATASDEVQFLLDVFFADYSGFDPCELLARFAGRVPQIHFNDMMPAGRGASGLGEQAMRYSSELGTGCMDLPAIYRAAISAGVDWIVIEQHTLRDLPLDSARANFKYCRSLILDPANQVATES